MCRRAIADRANQPGTSPRQRGINAVPMRPRFGIAREQRHRLRERHRGLEAVNQRLTDDLIDRPAFRQETLPPGHQQQQESIDEAGFAISDVRSSA